MTYKDGVVYDGFGQPIPTISPSPRSDSNPNEQIVKDLQVRLARTLEHFDNAFAVQMYSMLGLVERDGEMKQEIRKVKNIVDTYFSGVLSAERAMELIRDALGTKI